MKVVRFVYHFHKHYSKKTSLLYFKLVFLMPKIMQFEYNIFICLEKNVDISEFV